MYEQKENSFIPPTVSATLTGVMILERTQHRELVCTDNTGRKFMADPFVTSCLDVDIEPDQYIGKPCIMKGSYFPSIMGLIMQPWCFIVDEIIIDGKTYKEGNNGI